MEKFYKLILIFVIGIFLLLFFSSSNGYYEYELNKKTNLTQDAILRFEEDIKNGKEIDINEYVVNDNKDYSNKFTKSGLKLSTNINKIFSESVKLLFESIGNFVDE